MEPENEKTGNVLDRRDFLRQVGAGGAVLSVASKSLAGPLPSADASPGNEEELINYYPGARYLAGPWRLRIDHAEVGKQQQWYRREPSDSVTKAFQVTVPSCWQVYVPGFGGGVGWYFKEFVVPSEFKSRVLRLKFWAVDYFTEVWVNGEKAGSHEGGYTPFEIDITRQAKPGAENRLVVRVVDPPRPLNQRLLGLPGWEGMTDGVADDFQFMEIPMGSQSWEEGFNFGGIWQPVELLETDAIYVSDVFIEPKLTKSSIEAHAEVTSKEHKEVEGEVQLIVRPWKWSNEVVGQGKKSVQISPGFHTTSLHVDIQDPHPWSPEDPYLYVAEISVSGGERIRRRTTARFGLREFTVKDGYFHLNGKRIFVKGGHHQGTYPTTLEYPPSREFAYKEVRTFKDAGFNFCRLWIKPAPLSFLDAADELGLMLQEEPPLSNMRDSSWLLKRSLREVREMVKRDRNRPSVVIWNMINECDPPVKYVRQQCQVARKMDPTRLVTESSGGPTHYYLPHSIEGVSYLDEHTYPGAPIADNVYNYLATRGIPGQLCFFSEYGYGGMNDIESVLRNYGPHPRAYMEDYAGNALLKKKRDRVYQGSDLLKGIFPKIQDWREACQTVQADALRLHTEAMRTNPAMGGYNCVQVFDSNAIEIDGLVDFWRDKRKKSFYIMKEANKPLLLVIRCSPMNGRSDEEVEVKVTLVNEEKIEGPKKLTVRVKSPAGDEVFSRDVVVDAKPWVSVVFQERVKMIGISGRYPVEAILWEGGTPLVRKEDYCTIFGADDLTWPAGPLAVFDPDEHLKPFLKNRGILHKEFATQIEKPTLIIVTPFTALWQRPEEFQKFIPLLDWVTRGCTALFLGVPENGASFLTATPPISRGCFLSPFALNNVTPFSEIEATEEIWSGQRIAPYAWGLTDPVAGVPIPRHPVFQEIPQDGIMGREYGNATPVKRITTDWQTSEDTGTTVQIYSSNVVSRIGKGKVILTSLNLLPNLGGDALAEKLLCNLVGYALKGLPSQLEHEIPYAAESAEFESEGYHDCFTKYVAAKRKKELS